MKYIKVLNGNLPGGCFTNFLWLLQNNLVKIHNARNHIYVGNFKLKLCTCAQSHALDTCTKFQHEILIRILISAIHKFRVNILECSQNFSETTPWLKSSRSMKYLKPYIWYSAWLHRIWKVQKYSMLWNDRCVIFCLIAYYSDAIAS